MTDIDWHRKAAALLFGIPENEVSDKQRLVGKTYNIAKQYKASENVEINFAMKRHGFKPY